jgi:AraC family transcriptional regulator, regulatory protein of adaptative response / DNA-3-methyladenine glycosylase II
VPLFLRAKSASFLNIHVRKQLDFDRDRVYAGAMKLDKDVCYRALQTRDARFDGHFFTAVLTTKIYCRPICPARIPKLENCLFVSSAAAAHQAGFRPCLRCRPEIAPKLRGQLEPGLTVFDRALMAISNGTLDEVGVKALAVELGVSERHLRRLFTAQLGASPVTVAQTRRILFAKQLIDETALSMTDIAMAAGFASIRRFNDAIQTTYQQSPSALRKIRSLRVVSRQSITTEAATATISLKLPFSPPYDWDTLVKFLAGRAMPGIEVATSDYYQRTISLAQAHGIIEVRPVTGQNYLIAKIQFPQVAALAQIVDRLRHIFDLSANTTLISSHLATDPYLTNAVTALPGLRVPGAWDGFELAVRAILGQQISVAAATTLASRLVATYGEPLVVGSTAWAAPELRYVFPRPERLIGEDLTPLGIMKARSQAITALAETFAENPDLLQGFQTLEDAVKQLCQLPGIGEWTAHYIAMRSLREPDAFPTGDLALLRSIERHDPAITKSTLAKRAENWRPWRSYAAMYLWSAG